MQISFSHITDTHIGSYQGKIEQGGLNSRFVDFVKTWNEAIDFTIKKNCKFVLLTGDIFKNKDPQPSELQAFAEGIKKLNDACIYTIITLGNHDLFLSEKLRHSISAIDTLHLPYVIVKEKPDLFTLEINKTKMQFICFPYPIRSILKLKDNEEVTKHTIDEVERLYALRDKDIPTIFCGHFTITSAVTGTEQMSVDKFAEPVIPRSLFEGKDFIYVAMGHLHRYQKVLDKPLTIYGGSLNRIDFNEWKEDKGFVYLRYDGSLKHEFIKVGAKNFIDLKFEIQNEKDPEKYVMDSLKSQVAQLKDSVVRLSVSLSEENRNKYDARNVIEFLEKNCDYIHGSSIPHVEKTRARKEILFDESMNAHEALKKYSDKNLKSKILKDKFIAFGEQIIQEINGINK